MEKGNPERKSESMSRSHSQEVLDSSSASSVSVFADHSDGHNRSFQKTGEYSPRASMDEALKSEAAFIQYLSSIPPSELHRSSDSVTTRTRSPAAQPTVSKVGLDHLDNLCKLMEQLSELRDTNSKLQKRVQYLEDLKTLHDMHKEICEAGEFASEEVPSKPAGPYPLAKSATESSCPRKEGGGGYSRSPSKYLSRRSRHPHTESQRRGRSKSVGHEDLGEDSKSRRLFPKWSRVKEAFGWESERKNSMKAKSESGGNLTARRRSDESSQQTYRHPGSPTWYRNFPSIHSSVEDIHEEFEGRWKKISVVSEKFSDHLDIPHEALRRQKSTPSPGSEKLPSCRDADLKPKSFTIERDSYRSPDFSKFEKEEGGGKRGKSPWGRVKTIIERHRDSIKRRSLRQEPSATDLATAFNRIAEDSLDFKDEPDDLEATSKPAAIGHPIGAGRQSRRKANKPGLIVLDPDPEQACPRTPNSSPVLQRKSKWTRMTKALKGKREGEKDSVSTPTSPNNPQDGHFTFDAIDELSPSPFGEMTRVGSDSHVHQLALAVPPTDLMLQLQRNLSEDFHRKIREWDRMRGCGVPPCSPQWGERKPSDTWKSRKKEEKEVKPKIKDLSWLEKELQKVEKEKQRLSKERLKYEQRAMRLEKLRETVLGAGNSKREVLVKTSAGEFRFEGISDAFTKKLYEWETKRGVGMEYSTIALLNSSKLTSQGSSGTMQRMLSKSESSIADIGLNSSNSLPSAKHSDSTDGERQNHLSKADSEPDLSTLTAAYGGNLAVSDSMRQVHGSLEDEIDSPDGGPKDSDDDLEKAERKGSETYYGLLEENVLLLERLKEKEEICRRLEKDLEILDEKMEEMNSHHSKETQRYREKLWELHQQGASPREVLCCRRTMEQLRQRIEALERWTRKLRSERETVEVNFRHHSKEQESMTLDLLERMRELQAVGSSNPESESRPFSRLDADAIERLQDLSAQLAKQTDELQDTLCRKTRQIRQLKWELLHRDLSTVKMETERHSHSAAQKKRSTYAHWRSRSSEEPYSVAPQKSDPVDRTVASPDAYCISSSVEEFQATDLAHTVQQLSEEVQKLTCATSTASLTKCCQDEKTYTSITVTPQDLQPSRSHKKVSIKPASKRITVRRNSADNSSLLSTDDSRLRGERSSSHSDDSSDEYYSRVCYKANIPNNSEAERLLMSYGENPPRTHRKKKLQKVSKLNSSLGRRRSNTFHTNRDLQKPTIVENVPQKCHSFRVPRENYNEGSAIIKTPYFRRKLQAPSSTVLTQSDNNSSSVKLYEEAVLFRSEANKADFLNDHNNLIREASSDSKIPLILKVKKCSDPSSEKSNRKLPVRSMSEKTRSEAVTEKENLQKRRSKKRLKAPSLSTSLKDGATKPDVGESCDDPLQSNRTKAITSSQKDHGSSKKKSDASPSEIHSNEIPTITIQFPKRKHRKPPSIEEGATDEQSVTIVVPKKRSLSSECDSSISESSPREEPKVQHSDKTNNSSDSQIHRNSLVPSNNTDSLSSNSNSRRNTSSIGNIQLMKLVSLDNFDNPFDQSKISVPRDHKQNESQARKRKAQDGEMNDKNTPTEEMIDMINAGQQQSLREESHGLAKSSTTTIEHGNSENTPPSTNYIKSPSAPQLDWRKACAKKISRTGAPNVRTLIERYNQKVFESQTGKSPSSSNVSSPTTVRKTSTPVCSSCPQQYVPHFSSTPNTPTTSPSYTSLDFKTQNFPKSPPSSPSSVARSEALKKAREDFIASPQLSSQNSSEMQRTDETPRNVPQKSPDSPWAEPERETFALQRTRSDEDRMSHSSMDSMNLVMLRAGESCRESRMPKKSVDSPQKGEPAERHNLKASKSLSSSSLFKAVLHSDFKVPTHLLKLKRSRRKKDMSTVTELCRQSLLLTSEDAPNILAPTSHKSCPSSPELKSKTAKPNWLQRNIFRHK